MPQHADGTHHGPSLHLPSAEPRQSPASILVVEDEETLARDLRRQLEGLGYSVLAVVPTGEEAIDQAERYLPDLVVMDIRLAGQMDGIAAGAIIRKQLRLPVVYLTASADANTFLAVRESSDPFGFLVKPFQKRDLRTTVELALYRHQTDRRLREANRRNEAHARREGTIARIGMRALDGAQMHALLQDAAYEIAASMDVEFCSITQYIEAESSLLLIAGTGWKREDIGSARLDLDGTQYGRALGAKEPIVCGGNAPHACKVPDLLEGCGITSGVALGIGETRPWGVLAVHSRAERWFADDDLYFLQSMVHVLTTAIERDVRDALIRELSTPVLPIGQGILMAPLVGEMDLARADLLTDTLLHAIRQQRARTVILDVTRLRTMNATLAQRVLHMTEAARLMGSAVIVSGISASLAETIVTFGLDFSKVHTSHDLCGGINLAEQIMRPRSHPLA